MIFRHQLRAETRSMGWTICLINYGLKSVAWFVFGCVINIHAAGFSAIGNGEIYGDRPSGEATESKAA